MSHSASRFHNFLFDWDGCLSNSLPSWKQRIEDAFAKRGLTIEHEKLVREVIPSLKSCVNYGVCDLPEFIVDVLLDAEKTFPYLELHKDVLPTLKTLKQQNRKQAIVSSSGSHLIDKACDHYGLCEYLDAVFTRDHVKQTKPHPEPLLKAMAKIAADPESTCMIGDSAVDVIAGKAAGVTTIVFYPPENEVFYAYETIKELKPDHIIRGFSELLEL